MEKARKLLFIAILTLLGLSCITIIVQSAYLINVINQGHIFGVSELVGYEMRWNIRLPRDVEELYSLSSDHGMRGEGYRYSVYCVKSWDTPIFANAKKDRNADIEHDVMWIMERISVEKEYRVDFKEMYMWTYYNKNNSFLFAMVSQDKRKLTIVEKIT